MSPIATHASGLDKKRKAAVAPAASQEKPARDDVTGTSLRHRNLDSLLPSPALPNKDTPKLIEEETEINKKGLLLRYETMCRVVDAGVYLQDSDRIQKEWEEEEGTNQSLTDINPYLLNILALSQQDPKM